MPVRLIRSREELATLETAWNELAADRPFCSSDWLALWWDHYGPPATDRGQSESAARANSPERQLHVLAVEDGAGRLIGVAPWYVERSLVSGRVIRWLGDGEVCTDHVSLVCRPEDRERVVAAVAESLATDCDNWDRLDLTAVDDGDQAVERLLAEFRQHECHVTAQPAGGYWAVDLPPTWDDYLSANSKSHRKQLRQLERRVLESDRVSWHRVASVDQFEPAWDILIDLHQRRRKSLGEPGCFASSAFAAFHRQLAQRLFAKGQLRLSWLALDGRPAAAEYHLAGGGATYAYQGGVDPDRLAEEPGRLSTILCLRAAIDEGRKQFDFLRGDEPYKAHWRATKRPTFDYSVVPNRSLARLRGEVRHAAERVQRWARKLARS